MRRDTADDQPSLGRVLAAGSLRILRQSRLSRGQAVALVLSLIVAIAIGVMVQPRDRGDAPARSANAPASVDAGNVSDGADVAARPAANSDAVAQALDGLAGQIAAINDRLGDAVARERAARDRSAAPAADPPDVGPAPTQERAAPSTAAAAEAAPSALVAVPRVAAPSAPAARTAHPALRISPARPRQSAPQRYAAPRLRVAEPRRFGSARAERRVQVARHARRPRHERHRGLSALRDFFLRGLRLPF